MKTIILIAIIAAVASPIYADESLASQEPLESKKQDKRGVLGLGYGGYYSGGLGAHGLGGYSGYGHVAAAPAVVPAYSHGSYGHLGGYSGGYHAPVYSAPLRYGGYSGLGLGHGFGHGYTGYTGYNGYNNYLGHNIW